MRNFLIIILSILTIMLWSDLASGQTIIKDKKIKLNKKNYEDCYSANWNLIIPKLSTFSNKDIKHSINDSIANIVNLVLEDTIGYPYNNISQISPDCDTTSNSFATPTDWNLYYRVGQNSEKILSLGIYVNFVAGGGGMGFGTDYHSFNIDLSNNKIFSINSLFDSTGIKNLVNYVSQNIESPNEGILLDEDFNIFGQSEDYPAYGSYKFVGFRIDKKYLILNYSYDFGRGNGINELLIPLPSIKGFINKNYLWLYESVEINKMKER